MPLVKLVDDSDIVAAVLSPQRQRLADLRAARDRLTLEVEEAAVPCQRLEVYLAECRRSATDRAAERAAMAERAAVAIAAGDVIEAPAPEVATEDDGRVAAAEAQLARAREVHQAAVVRRNAAITECQYAVYQITDEVIGQVAAEEREALQALRAIRARRDSLTASLQALSDRGDGAAAQANERHRQLTAAVLRHAPDLPPSLWGDEVLAGLAKAHPAASSSHVSAHVRDLPQASNEDDVIDQFRYSRLQISQHPGFAIRF